MSVYPLNANTKNGTILYPHSSSYSEEYAQHRCTWYLTDQPRKDERGKIVRDYRLHSCEAKAFADYMAYDIMCPKCGERMYPIAREWDYHDLALYTCRECNNKK